MTLSRFTRRAGEERGAAMVMVAVFLPVLILFSSFVIDVGNWFEHRRHLQMQADAAVLAAAGEFAAGCTDDALMEDMARTYGGLKQPAPNTYNQQVGGTPLEKVLFDGLNQNTWPNQPENVDPDPPGGPPCETGVIDVKLAEADLPWFFRVAELPFINAHARVQFQRIDRAKGMLPIGVPDSNPKKAMAFFVDESTGTVIEKTPLCRIGTEDGLGVWSSGGGCGADIGPVPVRINAEHIGVRIALSGSDSTNCADALVVCYDAQDTNDGLVHIRGWSAGTASAQSPRARDVWLRSGNCPDGYFVASTTACGVEVVADVDFGSDPVALGAKIDATVGKSSYALVYDATEKLWKSDPAKLVPVPADGSRVSVGLNWTITKKADGTACGGTDTCEGTVETAVQRAVSASDARSGPIQQVRVNEHLSDGTLNALGANSFQRCASAEDTTCVHDLSVSIAIKGSLTDRPAGPDDPPVEMRVMGSSSLSNALDCDPDKQHLWEELAFGCEPEYIENDGAGCPLNRVQLWATPQPWQCSALKTGQPPQEVPKGMNTRINGGKAECVNPSRWKEYWADGDGPTATELANDPRLVWVIVTPFGAFDGAGNDETVPVLRHAAFYVTGWTGQGTHQNPCPSPPDDLPADSSKGGFLLGHFLEYRKTINNGEGSGEACDSGTVQICVPVLTK